MILLLPAAIALHGVPAAPMTCGREAVTPTAIAQYRPPIAQYSTPIAAMTYSRRDMLTAAVQGFAYQLARRYGPPLAASPGHLAWKVGEGRIDLAVAGDAVTLTYQGQALETLGRFEQ